MGFRVELCIFLGGFLFFLLLMFGEGVKGGFFKER